jgi:hypothetical protein
MTNRRKNNTRRQVDKLTPKQELFEAGSLRCWPFVFLEKLKIFPIVGVFRSGARAGRGWPARDFQASQDSQNEAFMIEFQRWMSFGRWWSGDGQHLHH